MLMKMRSKMQNQKGFTLVELMVVVVILGILVAIAIPVYNNITKAANQKAVESNLRIIDGAVVQYLAANPGKDATDVEKDDLYSEEDNAVNFVKEWPEGPNAVEYDINDDGTAEATKGDETGDWFGEGPHKLPVTWP